MALITIDVIEHEEDDKIKTYTFHVKTDDGSLWAHGEINFAGTLDTSSKESVIRNALENITDELYGL